MAERTLEQRVAILEQEVAALKFRSEASSDKKNWLPAVLGRFKDNADFAVIACTDFGQVPGLRIEDWTQ